MTAPDPLDPLRQAISTLERTVNGDAGMGVLPLRTVTENLRQALENIQRERADEKAEQRGQKKVLNWIFGTTAASAVGLIVLLYKILSTGGL